MFGGIPIFLTVFIVLLLAYAFRRAQLESRKQKREKEFWDREAAARHAPNVDLATVEYIHVPLESLPIGRVDEDEVLVIEDELRELAGARLLNLNDRTNTDIKLAYGTANFDTVVGMGEAFDRLLTLLCDYAKSLMENGRNELAVPVLEYGVSVGSDVSANYTLLGDCYRTLGQQERLDALIAAVEASGLLLKDRILTELQSDGSREDDTTPRENAAGETDGGQDDTADKGDEDER